MNAATKKSPAVGQRAGISVSNAVSGFDNLMLSPPRQEVPLDRLLQLLDGVKQTSPSRWIARCPAHDDRRASLAIRELDDGRLLLHDFAGCSAGDVLGAVGLSLADLYPTPLSHHAKPQRLPFNSLDALRAVAAEALIVATAATALDSDSPDRARLIKAASRIQAALSACCPDLRRVRV
ncbi:MAG TPA: DNA primase [Candidatus Desulfobacillus sp.]|nr:DNA primase [Candidatus Desulfobacillus sp.]